MWKPRSGELRVFLRPLQATREVRFLIPTYEQVGSGTTGHVEAVGLVFDPAVVSV